MDVQEPPRRAILGAPGTSQESHLGAIYAVLCYALLMLCSAHAPAHGKAHAHANMLCYAVLAVLCYARRCCAVLMLRYAHAHAHAHAIYAVLCYAHALLCSCSCAW